MTLQQHCTQCRRQKMSQGNVCQIFIQDPRTCSSLSCHCSNVGTQHENFSSTLFFGDCSVRTMTSKSYANFISTLKCSASCDAKEHRLIASFTGHPHIVTVTAAAWPNWRQRGWAKWAKQIKHQLIPWQTAPWFVSSKGILAHACLSASRLEPLPCWLAYRLYKNKWFYAIKQSNTLVPCDETLKKAWWR